jgi:hypothetical protein
MDRNAFDQLTRRWTRHPGSRRHAVALLTAGALGIATGQSEPGQAKGKQRCIRFDHTCDPQGGKPCCEEGHCCPAEAPDTNPLCCTADTACCSVEDGGGCCRSSMPLCCKSSERFPGFCEEAGGECCTDAVGGSCPTGFACCFDQNATPHATCCPKAAANGAAKARVSRNFHRRAGRAG